MIGCHISEEQLWSWVDRSAPELAAHVAECPRCRALAAEFRSGIAAGTAGLQVSEPALPTSVGPYVINGLLGEGGQRWVYAAEQQTPRRPVALKVLKAGRFAGPHELRHF